MRTTLPLRLLCGIALIVLSRAAAAQEPGEPWETTMKMEMAGGMSMPEQTQRICRPKGKTEEAGMPPMDDRCKLVESKQVGNKHVFKMRCEDGANRYTMDGETQGSSESYRGRMHMVGTMDGEKVDMVQTFSGKKLPGSCTVEDPMKQYKSVLAGECRKAMDKMEFAMFTMDNAPCADQKAEFCGKVEKKLQELRDPARYREEGTRPETAEMARGCGQDLAAIKREACSRSVGAKDWSFVASQCEEEGRALAKQHCEGRDYTAAMSTPYAPICSRYMARPKGRDYTAAATAPAPAGQPTPAAQPPSATDTIKKGADKLKKFLKF